ncbi:MAG: hypothetical protein JWM47_1379 [Acidimicrobiales bacterium]|nr:hypothetical protein [Acidimicrobiales bacterium]
MVNANVRGRQLVRVVLALVLLATTACSGDDGDPGPTSKRACARVQAGELGDILGVKVSLAEAGKDPARCTYTDADRKVEVQLQVVRPVEAGAAALLLTKPAKVPAVGDEAWSSQENATLGTVVVARRGGALLIVDLATPADEAEDLDLAVSVAEAGVATLPEVAVKKPMGARGAKACAPFEVDAVTEILGAEPEATVTAPPGSCQLTLPGKGLTVVINLLTERGATVTGLEAMVANGENVEKLEVGSADARWLPNAGDTTTGGQLDVLDGDRLIQVAVIGSGLLDDKAREMAEQIAVIAIEG